MATRPLGAESARNNPFPLFATFDRSTIASAVEVLIAVLDTMDGDSDNEPDGDELDGTGGEDDFINHGKGEGAGCPVADPSGCEHDGREIEDGL